MRYGISIEPQAKKALSKKMGLKMNTVGLVVNAKQPFLACSPGGVVRKGCLFEIVEMKCPSSRKKSVIFYCEKGEYYVQYLIPNAERSLNCRKAIFITLKFDYQCI